MMISGILLGWEEIAAYLRCSVSTAKRLRAELQKEDVIFERPRKGTGYFVCAFPEDLRAWAKKKAKNRKMKHLLQRAEGDCSSVCLTPDQKTKTYTTKVTKNTNRIR
jgi:hypothetical protein